MDTLRALIWKWFGVCSMCGSGERKKRTLIFRRFHSLSTFFAQLPRAPTHSWLMSNTSPHTGLSFKSGLVCAACVVGEKGLCEHLFFVVFTHFQRNVYDSPVHPHTSGWCKTHLRIRGSYLKVVWCAQHVWLVRKKIANLPPKKKQKRTCLLVFSLTHSLSTFFCTTPRAPTHSWLMYNTSTHSGLSVESGLVCAACVVHEKKNYKLVTKTRTKQKTHVLFLVFSLTHSLSTFFLHNSPCTDMCMLTAIHIYTLGAFI